MTNITESLVRPSDAARIVGVSERQLRNYEAAGFFPKRFLICPGGTAKAYLRSEIEKWMRERAASRDKKQEAGSSRPRAD